jgi:hypothetical protein
MFSFSGRKNNKIAEIRKKKAFSHNVISTEVMKISDPPIAGPIINAPELVKD